ncbi:MAG: hypothetical protein JXA20_08520 [Spirochaetes bacterium]|nr:hypothetical protein [Spirochaetota bacterium]
MRFPKQIGFLDVADFMEKFNQIDPGLPVVFDLTETQDIHSSFLGFLLHAKNTIARKNGSLVLLLSYTIEKILFMVNLAEYFSREIVVLSDRKTA